MMACCRASRWGGVDGAAAPHPARLSTIAAFSFSASARNVSGRA